MQLELLNGKRGGRRPGSGRKRIHSKGVAHRTREKISHRTPLHINFKFRLNIRNKEALRLLKRAILNARKLGLNVIHGSLQSNHIHLIVETTDNETLTQGMRSLTVTFAKGLNRGRIQIERYHLHVLRNPRETKNALTYVMFNKQKHEKRTYSEIDGFTSAVGRKELITNFAKTAKLTLKIGNGDPWPLPEPRTWLLTSGLLNLSRS